MRNRKMSGMIPRRISPYSKNSMIRIPAGWFWMGSEGRYPWESPRHRVFVDCFFISPVSVTRADYRQFLAATDPEEPAGWREPRFSDPRQPVVGVSWFDAVRYCDWLSATTALRWRLPTEAEWEKACRGGLDDAEYAWGGDSPDVIPYFRGAWDGPRRVAEGTANGYGLFNLGDNVHEWCRNLGNLTGTAEVGPA
jgi:formylglycine-generating enzyme